MADVPDLKLTCETVLVADHHVIQAWTFEGRHAVNGNAVRFSNWEEWDIGDDLKVSKSLGRYDAGDYERQVGG